MMINVARETIDDRHDKAVDFVVKYRMTYGYGETVRRLIPFMISYLSLTKNRFPEVARAAFAIVENYYFRTNIGGSGGAGELEAARNSCWDYLESTGKMYDFDSSDALAVRAVLGPLTIEGNDVGEATQWFLDFSDGIEDHSSEIESLLMRYFQ
jgi:hypothetical protein